VDGALTEVTGIFTTACRCFRIGKKVRWGTGDIGVSDVNTGVHSERLRRGAWQPLVRAPPQCVSHRRESNPLFQGTKYPTSSPPALVEPRRARQTRILLRRRCAASCELRKSPLCHRCPAHRLVPSGRPRALGHARFRASPGIRVSRSGFSPGNFFDEPSNPRTTKSPPEHLAREGSLRKSELSISLRRDRSHGPATRYRSAQSRSTV
jgi:hypothetical protein